jgi:hypothetical protein
MISPKSMALLHFVTLEFREFDAITSPFPRSVTLLKYHTQNLPQDNLKVRKGPNKLHISMTHNLS